MHIESINAATGRHKFEDKLVINAADALRADHARCPIMAVAAPHPIRPPSGDQAVAKDFACMLPEEGFVGHCAMVGAKTSRKR